MSTKYYFVKTQDSGYFKYTRSIQHFENDDLFEYLDLSPEHFFDFLKKIQHTRTLTKILYYI